MTLRLLAVVAAALAGGVALVVSAGGPRPTVTSAPPPVAGLAAPAGRPAGALASTWYCAGGTAGAGGTATAGGTADHRVVVANPTARPVTGLLTAYPGRLEPAGGSARPEVMSTRQQPFTVPARSRSTFRLADVLAAPMASAVVEVIGGTVAVEHQVVGPHGQGRAACASSTAATWHFAWGSTARDARELLVLFNPFASEVTVDATFVTEGGVRQPLRWQGLVVPARQSLALDVGEDVARHAQVAATVQARGGGRLVVDRVQVLDGSRGPEGLSLALGQPAPAEVAVFADGRVGDGTSEQIVLYNPGREPAEVEVTVHPDDPEAGPVQPFGIVVRPGRYETVDYGAEDRVPRGGDHSTVVRSRNGVPLVTESVRTGSTSHALAGALFRATTWEIPTASADGDQDLHVAVFNPDPERPATVSLELYTGGRRSRPPALQDVSVPPGGRVALEVSDGSALAGPEAARARSGAAVVVAWSTIREGGPSAGGPAIPVGEELHPAL